MDKRTAKTDEAIRGAVMHLLEEKPLSRLTVSAISREAGIDRKTFYSRFDAPEDAFASIAAGMVDDIVGGMEEDLASIRASQASVLDEAGYLELCLKLFFGRVGALFESSIDAHRNRNRHTTVDLLFPYYMPPLLEHIERGAFGALPRRRPHSELMASMTLVSSLWLHTKWLEDGTPDSLAKRSDEVCRLLLHGFVNTLAAP